MFTSRVHGIAMQWTFRLKECLHQIICTVHFLGVLDIVTFAKYGPTKEKAQGGTKQ